MKILSLGLALALGLPALAQRGPDNAPALGAKIPQVSATSPDGKTTIALSEPKRLTVLIFGSHT